MKGGRDQAQVDACFEFQL